MTKELKQAIVISVITTVAATIASYYVGKAIEKRNVKKIN